MQARRVDPWGVVFGVALPILAGILTLATTGLWIDRLPAEVATHWSGTAQPDGFSSPWTNAWQMTALVVLIGVGLGAVSAAATIQLAMRRVMLVIACVVTGMMTTVHVALVAIQLDLVDASGVRMPTWPLGVGLLIGLAAGVIGANLLRDYRRRVAASVAPPPDLPRAKRMNLPMRDSIGLGKRGALVLYGLITVAAVLTCVLTGAVWTLPLFLLAALLATVTTRYRFVVDRAGLRVLSLGRPVIEYDATEIAAARTGDVNPFREFGGWGLRVGGRRRYGLVTRRGPGLLVEMASGDTLTVTTDRAEAFAGTLNSLADDLHQR